jgi:hypothetical protein
MIFGRKCNKNQKFYLGEGELKVVDNCRYLGLVLDKKFTWKAHLVKILEKARNSICRH